VLAVGSVEERINLGLPGPYPEARRVVSVRFNEQGSVDESFGRGGMIEGPDGADIPAWWAAFPDGHLAGLVVRNEGGGVMTGSLQRFNPDGTLDKGFGQNGSVQLGSNLPGGPTQLLPARDGSLVITGSDPAGRAAVRRIAPGGQLDPGFGTACSRPGPPAVPSGAAVSSDGGLLATTSRTLETPPYRSDSFVFRSNADGCLAGRPLRIKGVSAGPPRLQGRRTALIGATYDKGLALVRIRR
jgi:hypothetical protein